MNTLLTGQRCQVKKKGLKMNNDDAYKAGHDAGYFDKFDNLRIMRVPARPVLEDPPQDFIDATLELIDKATRAARGSIDIGPCLPRISVAPPPCSCVMRDLLMQGCKCGGV